MLNLSKNNLLIVIVIILHLVGAVGTVIPDYANFFVSLTPLNLLITALVLIACQPDLNKELAIAFTACFAIGFIMEVIGVQTGWPFGQYTYGNTLGWKVMQVPLIIGINWFLLSYCFYSLTKHLPLSLISKSIIASLGMVILDFFIEPVAVNLDYWTWDLITIPTANYVAWFIIAFVLQILLNKLQTQAPKSIALAIIASQFFYFCVVFLLKV